jgi:hypothetical protein
VKAEKYPPSVKQTASTLNGGKRSSNFDRASSVRGAVDEATSRGTLQPQARSGAGLCPLKFQRHVEDVSPLLCEQQQAAGAEWQLDAALHSAAHEQTAKAGCATMTAVAVMTKASRTIGFRRRRDMGSPVSNPSTMK